MTDPARWTGWRLVVTWIGLLAASLGLWAGILAVVERLVHEDRP